MLTEKGGCNPGRGRGGGRGYREGKNRTWLLKCSWESDAQRDAVRAQKQRGCLGNAVLR